MIDLRVATTDDIPTIAAIHTISWRAAYAAFFDPAYLSGPIEAERLATWTNKFSTSNPHARGFIAEQDGLAIGFAYVVRGADTRWGSFVDNLHVLPAAKGQGVGPMLLDAAARWSREAFPAAGIYLLCYEQNLPARHFYERMGGLAAERLVTKICPDGVSHPEWRYHWPIPERLIRA